MCCGAVSKLRVQAIKSPDSRLFYIHLQGNKILDTGGEALLAALQLPTSIITQLYITANMDLSGKLVRSMRKVVAATKKRTKDEL